MEGTQISSAQENYAKAKSIYTETSLKVKKFRSRMETKKSEVENVAKKLEQAIRDKVGSPRFFSFFPSISLRIVLTVSIDDTHT